MKNLENYGVHILDAKVIEETNGGIFGWDDLLIGLAVAAGAAIINEWDDFEAGLSGQPYKNN